jgi:hypothetical protein
VHADVDAFGVKLRERRYRVSSSFKILEKTPEGGRVVVVYLKYGGEIPWHDIRDPVSEVGDSLELL